MAHPTRYAGVLFRSRLETRWAAFFDLAGWAWEYEPSDDVKWVPDFILRRSGLAIEVKPIEWSAHEAKCVQEVCARPDLKKVRETSRLAALVLGAYPLSTEGLSPTLGVLWLKYAEAEGESARLARMVRGIEEKFDFRAEGTFDFGWQVCGEPEFRNERSALRGCEVDLAWREAGNRTQWRGGAPKRNDSLFDD